MRKLIFLVFFIFFIFAGMLFGHNLIGEKGYVLIAMGETVIEMSVISALISLVLFLIVIRLAEWLFKLSLGTVLGSRKWFGVLSKRRQKKAMFEAINHVSTGQLVLAKKAVEKTFGGEFSGSNYILAADIDKRLNNGNSVERLLETAQSYPESETTARIQLADWHLNHKRNNQALEELQALPNKTPKTKALATLWLNTYSGLQQWSEYKDTLAAYKKILGDDYITWAQKATKGEFDEIASKQGAIALKEKWSSLSRAARKDKANQLVYIDLLIQQGMSKDAEEVLVDVCGKTPDSYYLPLFRKLHHPNPTKALGLIEKWIKNDTQNAELYSTLGSLAMNSGNKELAEKAISKALQLDKQQDDILLYAQLLEGREEYKQAAHVYRQLN